MNKLISDKTMFLRFRELAKFHDDDVEKIWEKYNSRFLTLVGNEISRQFMSDLKKSKRGELEQLRQVKIEANANVKGTLQPKTGPKSQHKSKSKITPNPRPNTQSHTRRKRKYPQRKVKGKNKQKSKDVCEVCSSPVLNVNEGGEVACHMCEQWFHLRCLHKPEDWASTIEFFFCDSCKSKIGFCM